MLLSISLIVSCMAVFLFNVAGKLKLFPNCSKFVTSEGIGELDKLINHFLLVVFKGSTTVLSWCQWDVVDDIEE